LEQIINTLKKHGLRITDMRRDVLQCFAEVDYALNHQDLELKMSKGFDRVTLYRTIKTFEEKGIIHRIASETDSISYALCKDSCAENDHKHKHVDDHIHFTCHKCEKTLCLDAYHIPQIKIPDGFQVENIQLIVAGLCNKCSIHD